MNAIEIARLFRFVREQGGPNAGPWVEAIQRITGNKKGDAWCASFVSMVLTLAGGGKNRLINSASCDDLLRDARAKGWTVTDPAPNDLFLVMNGPDDAVHVGFVIAIYANPPRFDEISGNTNDDGSRDGIGVFERYGDRARKITPGKYVFVRIPRIAE